jgi:hypothetical protein
MKLERRQQWNGMIKLNQIKKKEKERRKEKKMKLLRGR